MACKSQELGNSLNGLLINIPSIHCALFFVDECSGDSAKNLEDVTKGLCYPYGGSAQQEGVINK
jgi:hypothetical protein